MRVRTWTHIQTSQVNPAACRKYLNQPRLSSHTTTAPISQRYHTFPLYSVHNVIIIIIQCLCFHYTIMQAGRRIWVRSFPIVCLHSRNVRQRNNEIDRVVERVMVTTNEIAMFRIINFKTREFLNTLSWLIVDLHWQDLLWICCNVVD
jgi:hypothetical protein